MDGSATFCPRCGTAMEKAEIGGRMREVCPACDFILFRNPVPGVGVLVEMASSEGRGNGIVLIQRGQPPFVGRWALPAGFIEADESVEQAAVRECQEETGLEVELVELFGVYSFPEGPVQSGIIIFYRARPVGGSLRAGDDAQDVAVFAPDRLPQDVAFRTHREVLARWVQSQSPQGQPPGVLIRDALPEDEARVLALCPAPAGEIGTGGAGRGSRRTGSGLPGPLLRPGPLRPAGADRRPGGGPGLPAARHRRGAGGGGDAARRPARRNPPLGRYLPRRPGHPRLLPRLRIRGWRRRAAQDSVKQKATQFRVAPIWRRGRDSNPRCLSAHALSRRAR
jgi:8-oxo-dGTP diphosphatase